MSLVGASPTVPSQLLVGAENSDDAAVWQLGEHLAVVLTTDFFTPIVDDPFDFGRIAAANALSDVYAMGGEPKVVLNLMAFPKLLGVNTAAQVMRGSAEVVAQSGAVVAGGHTIEDKEPKFGLCVMGTVDPERMLRNGGAHEGDVVFLTKPLGTGILTTAIKRDLAQPDDVRAVIDQMAQLNDAAGKVVRQHAASGYVHACTDLTGFGLAGHLHEMAEASGLGVRIDLEAVPLVSGALGFARDGVTPGKTYDVRQWAEGFTRIQGTPAGLDQEVCWNLLADPQTSGGLLIAVDAADADAMQRDLEQSDAMCAARVGTFTAEPGVLVV